MINIDKTLPDICIVLGLIPRESVVKTYEELLGKLRKIPNTGSHYNWSFEKEHFGLTRHFDDHLIECFANEEKDYLRLSISIEGETKSYLTYIYKEWQISDSSVVHNQIHRCYEYLESTKNALKTLSKILELCPELIITEKEGRKYSLSFKI